MYNLVLDEVPFPIAPSIFTLKINNKNRTLDLMELGEVNILKQAGLTDITFELLIPSTLYPFASYPEGFRLPVDYLELLKKLKNEKKPFNMSLSRFTPKGRFIFETDMEVSLESYTIKESAENGQDIVVDMNLKQYKPYGTKTFEVVLQQETDLNSALVEVLEEPQRSSKEAAKSYIVKRGDTLWAICKRELGDGSKYPQVAAANNIKNPNLIYPGQVLILG